jgi:hypothetical protein
MFATEAVSSGLPAHIVARLLGHANINVTQANLVVFNDELVRTYQAFLTRRRATRLWVPNTPSTRCDLRFSGTVKTTTQAYARMNHRATATDLPRADKRIHARRFANTVPDLPG